jgi:predicted DNA-binding ribbon-helix-helix protein
VIHPRKGVLHLTSEADVKGRITVRAVPNQPKTPVRTVRIDDATWETLRAEAERREMTVSDLLRELIQAGLHG